MSEELQAAEEGRVNEGVIVKTSTEVKQHYSSSFAKLCMPVTTTLVICVIVLSVVLFGILSLSCLRDNRGESGTFVCSCKRVENSTIVEEEEEKKSEEEGADVTLEPPPRSSASTDVETEGEVEGSAEQVSAAPNWSEGGIPCLMGCDSNSSESSEQEERTTTEIPIPVLPPPPSPPTTTTTTTGSTTTTAKPTTDKVKTKKKKKESIAVVDNDYSSAPCLFGCTSNDLLNMDTISPESEDDEEEEPPKQEPSSGGESSTSGGEDTTSNEKPSTPFDEIVISGEDDFFSSSWDTEEEEENEVETPSNYNRVTREEENDSFSYYSDGWTVWKRASKRKVKKTSTLRHRSGKRNKIIHVLQNPRWGESAAAAAAEGRSLAAAAATKGEETEE